MLIFEVFLQKINFFKKKCDFQVQFWKNLKNWKKAWSIITDFLIFPKKYIELKKRPEFLYEEHLIVLENTL